MGWPGNVHDARVFANSLILKKFTQDNLLSNFEDRVFNGQEIPLYHRRFSIPYSDLAHETMCLKCHSNC